MSQNLRLRLWFILIVFSFMGIIARLFYWQVIAGPKLAVEATGQYLTSQTVMVNRGSILSRDGYPLVTNRPAFLLFAYLPDIDLDPQLITQTLVPILTPDFSDQPATIAAKLHQQASAQLSARLLENLSSTATWVPLGRDLDQEQKEAIGAHRIGGLGFDAYEVRLYPEASTSAQLLGFVGSDGTGSPKGYFGLEGFYDLELTGRSGFIRQEKDALGRPILIGDYQQFAGRDGRSLHTHLDRSIQLMVEEELEKGIERYGAVAGEVLIMDVASGAIIAMAAVPSYHPAHYRQYHQSTFMIPSISESYEPGSTFKALVLAAAIDQQVVAPDTTCDSTCDGPVSIGKYTISTATNQYYPGQTIRDILRRSDNTGMIFIANRLGLDSYLEYLNRFGIGQKTGIDLQAEEAPPLRSRWGDIDLATGSFGQGLAVTSVQMLSAFASLANQGVRLQPHVVHQVIDGSTIIPISPKELSRPVSPQTASVMTDLLIESGHQAGADRLIPPGYLIAGKSGTAQIPISGHYDQDKTIASFIGFAPANRPRFAMLVKLREPTSSPWGMETAAPLWYTIATQIFRYLDIPPDG